MSDRCFYIYNWRNREFMKDFKKKPAHLREASGEEYYVTWTPCTRYAKAYAAPSGANRRAAMINGQMGARACRAVGEDEAKHLEEAARAKARAAALKKGKLEPRHT